MAQNQNQGYQPIDESKVNWDQIEEKFGISKEVLERTGAKDNMLNFGKSGLLDVTMLIYDQKVKAAARLQLTRLPDGTYSVLPQGCSAVQRERQHHAELLRVLRQTDERTGTLSRE